MATHSAAELTAPTAEREGEAMIVLFPGGKAFVMPETQRSIQCVARTRAGKRCQMSVLSRMGSTRELVSRDGIITVYDVTYMDELAARSWLEQHCERHDSPDVQDDVVPEWERFDPERLHKHLVMPLPEQWEF